MNKHNNNLQVSATQEHTINVVPNNRELTESSEHTVSDQYMDNKIITSALKHSMEGSAGDQTDLCISKSQIHVQTANIAHTINTNINVTE